ncbi:MAG TPA: hypothetical protein VEI26_17640 [Terriglobales bacterium]|nr:hypothetical protein [Terriglobales bacterium]
MPNRLRWSQDPRVLVSLAAALLAFAVQSGELGSSDTMHRLQATHSFWTSEPPVFPNEYPEFGVHGRGGRLYGWYGIGQSLLMLPADIVGTWIERIPIFSDYNGNDPSVRNIFVTYTTQILINVLTALVCLRLLRLLGFKLKEALAGVLAVLFCTTHLHYTQNMMENNYIMLLTLGGFCFQYEWATTGNKRALVIGSSAFGLNLLTRLTTGLDLIAGGLFVLLALLWGQDLRGRRLWDRLLSYTKTAAPIYAVFLLIDRLYQFYRFGSFFNTYISVVAKEYRSLNPALPANYPWETPFHVGFLGPLITPEKSIFLFDPLIILTMLVATFAWKYFAPPVKAFVLTAFLLLLGYICFYARYTVWSGDFAWGDRYVSTAAEFAAFISVPLLLRYRQQLGRMIRAAGVFLIAVSTLIQFASLAFWLPLEIYQMETMGHPTFVIALRFENMVAFALGKMEQWGLNNVPMTQDPWDYVHITTWNFLPFVLRRVGEAPAWVVDMSLAIWSAALMALAIALWQLRSALSRGFLSENSSV